ncbi:MAG TPA: class I SAM-dependent methyltransferase [Actinomycetota bacterium]|nr:class I SAM-dependent methyltransferase [Actinomycetota bacterium]
MPDYPAGWHPGAPPSSWVVRFADLVPKEGTVLDLACGTGRHTRFFLERGHPVVAVDRDLRGIEDLRQAPGLEARELDLEDGSRFPLAGRRFDAVVVANYLFRPILPDLVAAVANGGALIYETFALGNEKLGNPTNPEFLLNRGELLDVARPQLEIVAYEDLEVSEPKPSVVQRIAAVRRG